MLPRSATTPTSPQFACAVQPIPGFAGSPGSGTTISGSVELHADPRNAQIIDVEWHAENNQRLTNCRQLTGKTTSPGYTAGGRTDRYWVRTTS